MLILMIHLNFTVIIFIIIFSINIFIYAPKLLTQKFINSEMSNGKKRKKKSLDLYHLILFLNKKKVIKFNE